MAELIAKLINLAREFSKIYTVLMFDLLQQTGYPEVACQITEKDLYGELVGHKDLVDDWLQYSADKRCDDGWYFKASENNRYLVGCLSQGGKEETEYEDKFKACAIYIKNELDQILKLGSY